MGSILSSGRGCRAESEWTNTAQPPQRMYKYPPKTGNYFANYFMLGGEKLDTLQPEAHLFGENSDLNYLGNFPVPYPYYATIPDKIGYSMGRVLKCAVNVRKESLRLVPLPDENSDVVYSVEFAFDSDTRCAITIYLCCMEEVMKDEIKYVSIRGKFPPSDTYYYRKGCNQRFIQRDFVFDPAAFETEDLIYNFDKNVIPIAIHCQVVEETNGDLRQSHVTIAAIEKSSDDTYILKPLKQKVQDGFLSFVVHDVYGVENKKGMRDNPHWLGEDAAESSLECVICMNEMRDTMMLPCKHLCLCHDCADSLRYQASSCPICRIPFRALLQIKPLRKINDSQAKEEVIIKGIPSGYEFIPLMEALNGPVQCKQFKQACTCKRGSSLAESSIKSLEYSPIYTREMRIYTPEHNLRLDDHKNLYMNVPRCMDDMRWRTNGENDVEEFSKYPLINARMTPIYVTLEKNTPDNFENELQWDQDQCNDRANIDDGANLRPHFSICKKKQRFRHRHHRAFHHKTRHFDYYHKRQRMRKNAPKRKGVLRRG